VAADLSRLRAGRFGQRTQSVDRRARIYYALKKLADAYPDSTGQNQYISSSYWIEAVPAFIAHPNADKTSMVVGPTKMAEAH